MSDRVKIVECPRDAWQGLPQIIPSEVKADYLRMLVAMGFKHIDAVSFVSPAAVPQMADSENVLEYFGPLSDAAQDVEIIGIIVNTKGAERAIQTGTVQTLGFPYSISPQFLHRNQNQTPEEALHALEEIGNLAHKAELNVVAYISMAFGNPYGDAWSIDEVVDACDLLIEAGVHEISLADTVGLATPLRIAETVADVLAVHDSVEIGVHLHARPNEAPARIRAAYQAGCRRFDAAIGGLGGCPFAQDLLVGNIATEMLIDVLQGMGAKLPPLSPLDGLIYTSAEIARKYSAGYKQ
jgi:hydroxymethylglutaryl-CoA lyase